MDSQIEILCKETEQELLNKWAKRKPRRKMVLYFILIQSRLNPSLLRKSIRGTTYSEDNVIFTNEFITSADLNSRWTNYISKMRLEMKMQFPDVVRFIIQKLQPYWESLR